MVAHEANPRLKPTATDNNGSMGISSNNRDIFVECRTR